MLVMWNPRQYTFRASPSNPHKPYEEVLIARCWTLPLPIFVPCRLWFHFLPKEPPREADLVGELFKAPPCKCKRMHEVARFL